MNLMPNFEKETFVPFGLREKMKTNRDICPIFIQLQYDRSHPNIIGGNKNEMIQKRTLIKGKPVIDGVEHEAYQEVKGKIKSIDVYAIDEEGHLLDREGNIIIDPESADNEPLDILHEKIFSATWL